MEKRDEVKMDDALALLAWAKADPSRTIKVEVEGGYIKKAWASDGVFKHVSTVEEAEKLALIARDEDLKRLAKLKAKYPEAA